MSFMKSKMSCAVLMALLTLALSGCLAEGLNQDSLVINKEQLPEAVLEVTFNIFHGPDGGQPQSNIHVLLERKEALVQLGYPELKAYCWIDSQYDVAPLPMPPGFRDLAKMENPIPSNYWRINVPAGQKDVPGGVMEVGFVYQRPVGQVLRLGLIVKKKEVTYYEVPIDLVDLGADDGGYLSIGVFPDQQRAFEIGHGVRRKP